LAAWELLRFIATANISCLVNDKPLFTVNGTYQILWTRLRSVESSSKLLYLRLRCNQ
jgi:hypothetical protein